MLRCLSEMQESKRGLWGGGAGDYIGHREQQRTTQHPPLLSQRVIVSQECVKALLVLLRPHILRPPRKTNSKSVHVCPHFPFPPFIYRLLGGGGWDRGWGNVLTTEPKALNRDNNPIFYHNPGRRVSFTGPRSLPKSTFTSQQFQPRIGGPHNPSHLCMSPNTQ